MSLDHHKNYPPTKSIKSNTEKVRNGIGETKNEINHGHIIVSPLYVGHHCLGDDLLIFVLFFFFFRK